VSSSWVFLKYMFFYTGSYCLWHWVVGTLSPWNKASLHSSLMLFCPTISPPLSLVCLSVLNTNLHCGNIFLSSLPPSWVSAHAAPIRQKSTSGKSVFSKRKSRFSQCHPTLDSSWPHSSTLDHYLGILVVSQPADPLPPEVWTYFCLPSS
jgi:hypothetical protein